MRLLVSFSRAFALGGAPGGLFPFQQHQVHPAGQNVDAFDQDGDRIADGVVAARASAAPKLHRVVEFVIVVVELADGHKTLDRPWTQLDKKARAHGAADEPVENVAEVAAHEVEPEQLLGVPFDALRAFLALAGVSAPQRQLGGQFDHCRGIGRRLRQQGLDPSVDDQVRVTPDRRREVQVALRGESEVADVFGLVLGAHHRAQQPALDDRAGRVPAGRFERALKFLARNPSTGRQRMPRRPSTGAIMRSLEASGSS